MKVRSYSHNDFSQLVALYQQTELYGGVYDDTRDTAERLEATAAQGSLLVAVDGDTVLGSAMILDNPHSFWLTRFVILPERSETIAQVLLERVEQIAKDRNHESIIVYTSQYGETLHERYLKNGFTKSAQYQCFGKE